MADLGQKQDSPSAVSESPGKQTSYPGLTLRDDQVEKVKGEHECKVGDEYDAYVRLRVKGITDDEFGNRLEFDVLNMDEFTPAEGGAEPDVEEEVVEEEPAEGKAKKPSKALTYS